MRKIMACLDVGSNTIKLVVGEMVKKKLNILAACDVPSEGVVDGLVVDPNKLLKPLHEVIHRCEEVIGLSIRQMVVAVPALNASFEIVSGTVPIENEGNLIEGKDIIRVVQNAVKSRKKSDLEYISMIPTSFSLDDNRIVKDPKGLTSKVLSTRGVIVSTPKENIYPILACLERLNIEVVDITLTTIGDYFEYKNKVLDKQVGVVINIGAATTTMSVFNKGVLTNTKVRKVGGEDIDKDISYIHGISLTDAKYLKEKFATSHSKMATSEEIEVQDKTNKKIVLRNDEVSKTIMNRVQEILKMCSREINGLTKKEISYIILTGGITECKNFELNLYDIFENNAIIGIIKEIGVRHNRYSSCLGILKYYAYNANLKDKDYSIFTIDEQQTLSGANFEEQDASVIGKLFGYIFNG